MGHKYCPSLICTVLYLLQATVIVSAQTNSGYRLDNNSAYEEVPRK